MAFIQSLKLKSFRSYDTAALANLSGGFIVLYGPNGAGKTNVLEAVSLLSPGRGLRMAKNTEIQKNDAPAAWAVASEIDAGHGIVKIGTGLDPANEKRVIRINGVNVRAQSSLAEHLSVIWLTPQMDRLFLDSSSHRRKFLDRLIFAFDPGHAGRVSRYENAMSQRSKLLRDGRERGGADDSWLSGLEAQMAETGVSIAAARLGFTQRLQEAAAKDQNPHFPLALLEATGTIETLLQNAPALEVEDMFTYQLRQSRERDSITGGAASGPHKSDLAVRYADKNMAADQCSTGEQKALLIGLILAHARLIAAERGAAPILLLDEVAAHLDENRRAALYDVLEGTGAQVWLTGTDRNLFDALESRARFFEVRDGAIIGQGLVQ